MSYDDELMDYLECAYVNGYDVDDNFNLTAVQQEVAFLYRQVMNCE